VQILIDRGARLDNALLYSVDDYAMVDFLLSRGAKIVSALGKISAITNTASAGNIEVVRLLISHANDAEIDSSSDALNWAAARGRIDAVKLLIRRGFDVNARTKDCQVGETPLLAACESKKVTPQRMAVAKLLLKHGADVNARNQDGKTTTELLFQNNSNGLLRKDTELQQLLAGTDTS
jgi:ankyrin repeat protein